MYIVTILCGSIFLLLLLFIIYWSIKDKDSNYTFILLIEFFFGLLMTCGVYEMESKDIKYPYTKTYTMEVYYMDGGKETIQCHCQGYIEPFLQATRGCGYNLIVGDEVIRSVTRYKIVSVQKHMK